VRDGDSLLVSVLLLCGSLFLELATVRHPTGSTVLGFLRGGRSGTSDSCRTL